jgi:hypothetical protein
MEAKTKYTKKELLELIKLDSERYYNLANEFYKRFVAMNRCKCCNDKLIKSGKHVLTCKHYKDAVGEFTKEYSWNRNF